MGANYNVDSSGNVNMRSLLLALLTGVTHAEGTVFYNADNKALELKTDIVGSTQSVGQEFWVRVVNKSGVSIPDGSLVFVNGFDVTSGRPTIALASASAESTADVSGFTTNTMANNAEGFVTVLGFVNDLDTSSFAAGAQLFLSETPGVFTATKPTVVVPVGIVTKSNATTGQILVVISRLTTQAPIYAQLSSSVDQIPATTNPVPITFNTQDAIKGVTHSTTVNPSEITVDIAGTYLVAAQPQVGKTSGGVKRVFDMFLQVKRNGGFLDEVNSNIKLAIKDSDITDVIVSLFLIELAAGESFQMMQKVDATGSGLGLQNTDSVVGPPSVPRTPSIIFAMGRISGVS